LTNSSLHIEGFCVPEFNAVKQAFIDNFHHQAELGACISIMHKGKVLVDLWGGYQDIARTKPWKEDTLVCVMSVTKGIASICLLALADKKIIDLDAPIARYWPEFAQAGKATITIRCMLGQLAGIPVADAAPSNSLYQLDVLFQALEVQAPLWKPGTTPCYHSFTHGLLCQKLVELTTGKSMGTFLREDLFGPRGIDFFIGLNPEEEQRCTDILVDESVPSLNGMNQDGTLLARAWKPAPFDLNNNFFQDPGFRQAEFSSANGHSNARALAQIYGTLVHNGNSMISHDLLENAIQEQWDAVEEMTHRHFRYGTGFMLNNTHFSLGSNPRSFGHPGLGGALGFADPDAQLGFGYCGNRIHAVDDAGPCGKALIDAVYACLKN